MGIIEEGPAELFNIAFEFTGFFAGTSSPPPRYVIFPSSNSKTIIFNSSNNPLPTGGINVSAVPAVNTKDLDMLQDINIFWNTLMNRPKIPLGIWLKI